MRKSRIFDELGTLSFYADCVIDGVGTLWLTFFAVFIGMTFDPDVVSDRVVVGVVIGGTVYGILETFGPIQWAAINPIIAMAFAITRKISVVKALLYIVSELGFAVVGAYLAWVVSPSSVREGFVAPAFAADVTDIQAVCVTAVISATLTVVVVGGLDDVTRTPTLPALTTGVTTAVGIVVAAPHSAGIANPAVAFALAAITNTWYHQWIFWVGGFSGAILATVFYILFAKYGGQGMKEYKERREACSADLSTPVDDMPPRSYVNDACSVSTLNVTTSTPTLYPISSAL